MLNGDDPEVTEDEGVASTGIESVVSRVGCCLDLGVQGGKFRGVRWVCIPRRFNYRVRMDGTESIGHWMPMALVPR